MQAKAKRTRFVKPLSLLLMGAAMGLSGCSDDYPYDDKAPDNLGGSIYEYLQSQGNFTTMLRLIDDLGYSEVLAKTGSKTLFPATDEAFGRFFKSNPFGASSYEELTPAQKRLIMNGSMVNMAYLSDMLPNVSNTSENGETDNGLALRRFTSGSNLDSVIAVRPGEVIQTDFWKRFNDKALFLSQTAPMMTHYTSRFMSTANMTATDFSDIYGKNYSPGEIYVDNVKVSQADIICENGYIHVMEDVIVPLRTMAQNIDIQPDTKIFKSMLDRFCAPYFDASVDRSIKDYYNGSTPLRQPIAGMSSTDSVFVKRYFNEATTTTSPSGQNMSNYGLLYYDPNDPNYSISSSEQDMGVMFVPSDRAMEEYFNGSEGGYLRDAYGSWDNVPTDIMASFLKNHQKRSFISSLPHLWSGLTDETSYAISISQSDVMRAVPSCNGIVYIIDKVLPPIDYKGVYASTLTADNTKVMKWAITDDWFNLGDQDAMRFYMFFRSMENMYNLLVPTDEAFHNYRDPISWAIGGSNREIWDFQFNEAQGRVVAEVHGTDADGNKTEAVKQRITDLSIIRNRLRDIVDMLVVVGNNDGHTLSGYIDDGTSTAYLTKGGATIRVRGRNDNVAFTGGGDIEQGLDYATIAYTGGRPSIYDSQNGRTFFINSLLHDATQNVYDVLASRPEFSEFFNLCQGDDRVSQMFENDEDFKDIFSSMILSRSSAVGVAVSSFNNYRYTIFVPTNEAIRAAIASDPKLYDWEDIANDMNIDTKKTKALYLLKFLRYHFVDNSAYVGGNTYGPLHYETGARNAYDKFHKVTVSSNGTGMTVTDENGTTANVVTKDGLYNLMARDLIVNNSDYLKATEITSSSRAVVHQIDKVLNYKN